MTTSSTSLGVGCAALIAAAALPATLPATLPAPGVAPAAPPVAWTATYEGGIAKNDEATDTATSSNGSVAVTGSSVRQAGDRGIVTVVYAPRRHPPVAGPI